MKTDPIFAAIHARRQAFAEYINAVEADAPDAATNALAEQECRSTLTALRSVPTTVLGLLAFCEFGAEIARECRRYSGCGLADWAPGHATENASCPDAETLFLETLERAARLLRPMED